MRKCQFSLAIAAGLALITGWTPTASAFEENQAEAAMVQTYLNEGQFAEGEQALLEALKKDGKSDSLRFQLGALRFIRSVERLGQSLYQYGLRSDRGQRMGIPFLRLPIPVNPDSKPFVYEDARRILQTLIDDLAKAEAVLAEIQDESVKVRLRLGETQLDFEGDGQADAPFLAVLNQYFGGNRNRIKAENLDIAFDRGDVAWLRGYCHFLSALSETILAYDGQELFDLAGPLLFAKAKTPHKFMQNGDRTSNLFDVGDGVDVMDAIAVIHMIRLPIKEPARMKAALEHFKVVMTLSQESWRFIMEETDNDREWLPNPTQTGALGVRIQKQRIDAWLQFVNEMEDILDGKRLVPFWRLKNSEYGVNLNRVFTEPREFDLVLWIQGLAAEPYLEKGDMTRKEVWGQIQRVFGGEFFGFVFWFN